MILTPEGERPVETLRIGDLVMTRDNGPQPIRWISSQTVLGRGMLAPIRISEEAMPQLNKPLLVSPQHRMLISGYETELLFGSREVLAPAGSLVRLGGVAVSPRREITYIHVMFDQHEVIYANGAATESFFAADHMMANFSHKSRQDLFTAFPHLRADLGAYGTAARRCLKGFETALLTSLGAHDTLTRAA